MKRILMATVEMMQAGLPTALHANARTERDFERWGELIAERPEIQYLAFEFATGAGRGERLDWHVAQITALVARVPHRLGWVVREIGRAAGREGGRQYVQITGCALHLKKTRSNESRV